MFVVANSYQQQQERILNNQLLFSKYGIHFNEYETDVLSRPREEVLLSIVMYQIKDSKVNFDQISGKTKYFRAGKIPNPEGWIKVCLERRYWDEPSNFAQIYWRYNGTSFWNELFPNGHRFNENDIFYDDAFRSKKRNKPRKHEIDYCPRGERTDYYFNDSDVT